MELVDTPASKAGIRKGVWVRVPPRPPNLGQGSLTKVKPGATLGVLKGNRYGFDGPSLAQQIMKSFVEVTREEVKSYYRKLRIVKMLRNSEYGRFGSEVQTLPFIVKVPEQVYSRVVQFGRRQQIQNLNSVGSSPTTATTYVR